jgi:hypothetical protein
MPVVKIVLKYPEKFLNKIVWFSYITDLASKKRYPMGKKAGNFENTFFKTIFYLSGLFSFWLFKTTNWICKKIFGIDWIEENSKK